MSAQIEDIRVEGDEAPADEKNVWGYLDQRGGLYGWDPDTPFPGYLVLSGAKPIRSEAAYRRAVVESRIADNKAQEARNRRGRAPSEIAGDETDEGDDAKTGRSRRAGSAKE